MNKIISILLSGITLTSCCCYPVREAQPVYVPPTVYSPFKNQGPMAEASTRPEDIHITQEIRRDLNDDTSLSQKAKNVDIITNKGEVTLYGPVENKREEKAIYYRAQQVAGVQKVFDELYINE